MILHHWAIFEYIGNQTKAFVYVESKTISVRKEFTGDDAARLLPSMLERLEPVVSVDGGFWSSVDAKYCAMAAGFTFSGGKFVHRMKLRKIGRQSKMSEDQKKERTFVLSSFVTTLLNRITFCS
jgi:hypothetical protein